MKMEIYIQTEELKRYVRILDELLKAVKIVDAQRNAKEEYIRVNLKKQVEHVITNVISNNITH